MTPETKIKCPKCRGWGRTTRSNGRLGRHLSMNCNRCHGTGKITWAELSDHEQIPGTLYCKADVEAARGAVAK